MPKLKKKKGKNAKKFIKTLSLVIRAFSVFKKVWEIGELIYEVIAPFF